jgi:hypothetical protein
MIGISTLGSIWAKRSVTESAPKSGEAEDQTAPSEAVARKATKVLVAGGAGRLDAGVDRRVLAGGDGEAGEVAGRDDGPQLEVGSADGRDFEPGRLLGAVAPLLILIELGPGPGAGNHRSR